MKQLNTKIIALHRIEIASPCTASWAQMKGNERVRHCDDCNKSVFNLSAMPEAEAANLLAGNMDGELCVRFHRRADGTVMTSDCSTSPRAYTRRALRKLPGMASGALLATARAALLIGRPPGPVVTSSVPQAQVEPEPVVQVMMGAPPVMEVAPADTVILGGLKPAKVSLSPARESRVRPGSNTTSRR